ncbi:MAG TPA: amidohydrolase, partial [Candidatus Izemoplasmatales bacterium]|nr:amidohydrolase [Candidatus Izemoplasmatales bacterium]
MFTLDDIRPYENQIVAWRRKIHSWPETGFDTIKTHDYIRTELENEEIEVHTHVGTNSIVGIIRNGTAPIIGLRADIDALPLQEETRDRGFKSQRDGFMHACGHDAHAAMLLGAAKLLCNNKTKWSGTVKLIFQEAEEGPDPGGAYGIVESGLLDDVEDFYALHVSPDNPAGVFVTKSGNIFASVAIFRITAKGKGCHAAYPEMGKSPIIPLARIVEKIQDIVPNRPNKNEKLVVSVTQVHSGTTHNIIPETAMTEGTIRAYSKEAREYVRKSMEKIIEDVSSITGVEFDFSFRDVYEETANTESSFIRFRNIVVAAFG